MSDDTTALLAALAGLTEGGAHSLLTSWEPAFDWPALPAGELLLADGSRLRFEKRRRSVAIERVDGGCLVIDLGRRDRMRPRDAILTADLVEVVEGPEFEVALAPSWAPTRGDISIRDPLDPRGKRAVGSVPLGAYPVRRHLDESGQVRLISVGSLEGVTQFTTHLMGSDPSYAHLRTVSGLAGISDAGRTAFMRSVTQEHADRARAEGFAQVVTKAGPIGVLVDCGEPGDHLTLQAWDVGAVGLVIDLRRPPVRDGGIVDPTPS